MLDEITNSSKGKETYDGKCIMSNGNLLFPKMSFQINIRLKICHKYSTIWTYMSLDWKVHVSKGSWPTPWIHTCPILYVPSTLVRGFISLRTDIRPEIQSKCCNNERKVFVKKPPIKSRKYDEKSLKIKKKIPLSRKIWIGKTLVKVFTIKISFSRKCKSKHLNKCISTFSVKDTKNLIEDTETIKRTSLMIKS